MKAGTYTLNLYRMHEKDFFFLKESYSFTKGHEFDKYISYKYGQFVETSVW